MDIGAWFLQREAERRHGEYCESISLLVKAMKGGASGGTMASMMNVMKEARADREVARTLARPYSLNPADSHKGPDGGDQRGVRFNTDARTWTAPFVMASVNTRVVRRSHALLGYPWGQDFQYSETIRTGSGASGWLRCSALCCRSREKGPTVQRERPDFSSSSKLVAWPTVPGCVLLSAVTGIPVTARQVRCLPNVQRAWRLMTSAVKAVS
jgi:short subunit dehydrogenase-like uncharacterized protein